MTYSTDTQVSSQESLAGVGTSTSYIGAEVALNKMSERLRAGYAIDFQVRPRPLLPHDPTQLAHAGPRLALHARLRDRVPLRRLRALPAARAALPARPARVRVLALRRALRTRRRSSSRSPNTRVSRKHRGDLREHADGVYSVDIRDDVRVGLVVLEQERAEIGLAALHHLFDGGDDGGVAL